MSAAAPRRAFRLPRSPLTVAASLLAVAGVVAAIVVVGPEATAKSPGRVVTATRGVIQSTVSGTGNLQPAHQLDLSFATGGTVKQVYVKQGEHVASGQLIARIDDARQRLAVQQAQAALDIAETALDDAQDAASGSDETASAGSAETASASTNETVSTTNATTTASSGLTVVPISTTAGASTTDGAETATTPTTTTKAAKTTGAPEATEDEGTAATTAKDGEKKDTKKKATGKKAQTTTTTETTPTPSSSSRSETSSAGSSSAESGGNGSGGASSGGSGGAGSSGSGGSAGGTVTTVAAAKADVTSAQLNLKDAQEALEHTRLRAPLAGTVTALNGAVGDSVAAAGSSSGGDDSSSSGSSGASGSTGASGSGSGSSGSGSSGSSSTAFASLAQLSRLDLEVSFSESDIGKLKVGQAATVTLTALTGVKLAAKVTSIGILSSSSSGVVSYPVTLALTQKGAGTRTGMSATAEVVVAQAKGISVPNQALTGSSVTVEQNGKQLRRSVTTGVVGDSTTQILSGLKTGDRVVLPALSVSSGGAGASGPAGAGGAARLGGGGFGGGMGGMGAPSFSRGPGGPG